MALVTIVEAAVRSGLSIELLESFARRCPKRDHDRVLVVLHVSGTPHVDDTELDAYLAWLREPWPLPSSGRRPRIPDPIARDVKEECHQACAICGDMNHGELAHIDAVADTLDNSPDNLIFLCPNHHTEYDLGYRPASNIDRDTLLAAKRMKRASRRRMLKYEGNVAAALRAVLKAIHEIEPTVTAEADVTRRETYATELTALLGALPQLVRQAQEAAACDQDFAAAEAALVAAAPQLLAATDTVAESARTPQVAAASVVFATRDVVSLDETPCPHCAGSGLTGLMGRLCGYCGGDQVVSERRARDYDPEALDEEECPHCRGAGMIGLSGTLCRYCGGDQVVSEARAAEYDRERIDEVACPHCGGAGTTGLMNRVCEYCDGDMVVSAARVAEYDPNKIDEVACPHCGGAGTIGLMNTVCDYCRGDQTVSGAQAAAYSREEMDEIECPRCRGAGTIGFGGTVCALCDGDQVVSSATAAAFAAQRGSELP